MDTSAIKKDLFDLFDLDKVSPEKAAEMIQRLGRLVIQAVLIRVLPLLSESEFDEYEKITEGENGPEKVIIFLAQKIPDFEKIVKEEAEILRNEMAKDMSAAKIIEDK